MSAHDIRLDDGFSTIITLSGAPTIKLYERDVTPPGFTNGGAIDITTMRNTAYRTQSPRQLKSTSNVTATVAYATSALPVIQAQLGVNQLITVTFPDGSTLSFWGWLDEFTPGANSEGEQPTATITVIPSNHNLDGDEVAPFYTTPEGSVL